MSVIKVKGDRSKALSKWDLVRNPSHWRIRTQMMCTFMSTAMGILFVLLLMTLLINSFMISNLRNLSWDAVDEQTERVLQGISKQNEGFATTELQFYYNGLKLLQLGVEDGLKYKQPSKSEGSGGTQDDSYVDDRPTYPITFADNLTSSYKQQWPVQDENYAYYKGWKELYDVHDVVPGMEALSVFVGTDANAKQIPSSESGKKILNSMQNAQTQFLNIYGVSRSRRVDAAYFGTSIDTMYIAYPAGVWAEFTDDFNPAQRSWYQEGLVAENDTHLTDPYLDFIRQVIVFTMTRKVYFEGSLIGLVAIDFPMASLSSTETLHDNVAYVFSRANGQVFTTHKIWETMPRGKKLFDHQDITGVDVELWNKMVAQADTNETKNAAPIRYSLGGRDYYSMSRRVSFSSVMSNDKDGELILTFFLDIDQNNEDFSATLDELEEDYDIIVLVNCMSVFLTLVGLSIFVYFISRQITQPLESLIDYASWIARQHELQGPRRKEITKPKDIRLIESDDIIGELVTAFKSFVMGLDRAHSQTKKVKPKDKVGEIKLSRNELNGKLMPWESLIKRVA